MRYQCKTMSLLTVIDACMRIFEDDGEELGIIINSFEDEEETLYSESYFADGVSVTYTEAEDCSKLTILVGETTITVIGESDSMLRDAQINGSKKYITDALIGKSFVNEAEYSILLDFCVKYSASAYEITETYEDGFPKELTLNETCIGMFVIPNGPYSLKSMESMDSQNAKAKNIRETLSINGIESEDDENLIQIWWTSWHAQFWYDNLGDHHPVIVYNGKEYELKMPSLVPAKLLKDINEFDPEEITIIGDIYVVLPDGKWDMRPVEITCSPIAMQTITRYRQFGRFEEVVKKLARG